MPAAAPRGAVDDSAIDESALARLEALQKRQMMDMFGFDYDQEEADKAAKRQKLAEEKEQKRKDKAARLLAAQEAAGRQKKKKKKHGLQQPHSAAGRGGDRGEQGRVGGAANGSRNAAGRNGLDWFAAEVGSVARAGAGGLSSPSPSAGGSARVREERAAELERERAAFMSANVSKVHRNADEAASAEPLRGRKFRKETADADFVSTARIVEELGASRFEGRDKKQWELKRLKALGAKAPKNEKCPIFILKGMRAKAKEREAKQKARDMETGMAIKKTKKKTKPTSINSHHTTGVLKVNPKMKTERKVTVGGLLKGMGRTNKVKTR
eukprot:Tamp_22323.p1 GENE.Tamp_22323~~Tamp_22323.p1  ORF type:complete len:326 (+),score=100.52 Tamp_22323:73-1050(+)